MKTLPTISRLQHMNHRSTQRGISAVLTSVMLLLAASIAVLYLNRSLIFEQRTAANYTRSTTALEMAEAGIEWATGMLNTSKDITSSCALLSTAVTPFVQKYVLTEWATKDYVVPATTTYPGCKLNGNTYTCSCPDVTSGVTTAASLGTDVLPGFTVQFSAVSGDTASVKITAVGCTATGYACTSANASASDGPDARATVSVILKAAPLLRSVPASALSCGGSCAVGGNYKIINTDVGTNGVLVNSGSTITSGNGTVYTTLPGIPYQNALVGSDSSLSTLATADPTCASSKIFSAYFGSTLTAWKESSKVTTISCTSANDCGTKVMDAYNNNNARHMYFPTGFYWNNSTGSLGTQDKPVTIVTDDTFSVSGNIDIYGMVFSNSPNTSDFGTGTSNIYGGIVTCGGYSNNGSGTLQYDPTVLGRAQFDTASWVRVPGSWRDW